MLKKLLRLSSNYISRHILSSTIQFEKTKNNYELYCVLLHTHIYICTHDLLLVRNL